jgi:hypothetical protein
MTETTAVAEGETMVVAFDPTEDEQVSAQRAVLRVVRPWMSRPWFLPAFGLVPALAIAALAGSVGALLSTGGFWLCVGFWILLSTLLSRMTRWQVRRYRSELGATGTATTLDLSPWGCRMRWGAGEQGATWAGMVRAVETAEHYLLFYSRQCAFFIPRRALTAPEDARFRRLLKAWMGERSQIAA